MQEGSCGDKEAAEEASGAAEGYLGPTWSPMQLWLR